MKIAMPINERDLNSNICPSFGRAPYFLIHKTDTEETYYLDNSVAAASQGGAGIRSAQMLVDHGVEALLTQRCGENAEEVLQKSEVQIFESIPGTAQQNIDAFVSNKLVFLNDFHPGLHTHDKQKF